MCTHKKFGYIFLLLNTGIVVEEEEKEEKEEKEEWVSFQPFSEES